MTVNFQLQAVEDAAAPSAGQVLTATSATAVAWSSTYLPTIGAHKAADESVTASTTLQDDNHLTVSLLASSIYAFRAFLFFNTAGAAPGFKAALNGTAGVTSLKAQVSIYDDTTNALTSYNRWTAFAAATGSVPTAGNNSCVIEGTIETSTAGTLLIQWAQNVSDAANTTVQRNSNLLAWRLG